LVTLGGVRFEVGSRIVHLRGKHTPQFPLRVAGIAVKRQATHLHFLHAVEYGASRGTGLAIVSDGIPVARYIVRYANGQTQQIPVRYGYEVRDWWIVKNRPNTIASNTAIAWQGDNTYLKKRHSIGKARLIEGVRIFRTTWRNPHPDWIIETLDLESLGGECDPFVLAISLSPIPGNTRG
jgi:hypothetical protein